MGAYGRHERRRWKPRQQALVSFYAVRSRGQTRTSNEAIIQHAIITAKPALNDPVR